MNATLASAESSAVISTLKESKQVNSFVYSEGGKLHVNHSLQVSTIPISSGTVGANRTFTFNLPKNGLLGNTWLKVQMPGHAQEAADDNSIERDGTPGAASNVEGFSRLGLLKMVESIKLESSGRVLESLSKWQILQRLSDLPVQERAAAEESYRMNSRDPEATPYTACLLLPFFWYKDMGRYHLDTDFQEAHRIVVTLNACETVYDEADGVEAYVAHVPTTADLICEYRQVDDHTRQEIVQKNYGSGMLSKVVRLSREEAYSTDTPGSTAEREVVVDLKESDCITGIYIAVECPNVGAKASYATAEKEGTPVECTNFEVVFAGQSIMNVPGEWVQHYGRSYGRPSQRADAHTSTFTTGNALTFCYKISFGGLHSDMSNVVALREISRAQLRIKYKPAAAATHNIHVGYESVSFLTTSSATGRTNLSISS